MKNLPPDNTYVLLQTKIFKHPTVGSYSHEKDEVLFLHYVCRSMSGMAGIIEWWPLPELGTGNKV